VPGGDLVGELAMLLIGQTEVERGEAVERSEHLVKDTGQRVGHRRHQAIDVIGGCPEELEIPGLRSTTW
jgi:hypothetical protein